MNSAKKNKKIISYIIYFVIIILIAYILITAFLAKKENKPTFIFGIGYSIVLTDSMTPEINKGDLIVYKKTDYNLLKVGEDIIFKRVETEPLNKYVVHRIVRIEYSEEGKVEAVITSGIKEGAEEDVEKVFQKNFAGIKIFSSKSLGKIIIFLSNPINWLFVIIFCVIIKLIIEIIKKLVLYNKQSALEDKNKKDLSSKKDDFSK